MQRYKKQKAVSKDIFVAFSDSSQTKFSVAGFCNFPFLFDNAKIQETKSS